MRTLQLTSIAILPVLTVLMGADIASAQTFRRPEYQVPSTRPVITLTSTHRHIDSVASQLERDAENVQRRVRTHFRYTPQYRHLDRDVAEMTQLARHLHDLVHSGASLRHLQHDVDELDRLFHHVEEVVSELARDRSISQPEVYLLRKALKPMESSLHHLKHDLGELRDRQPRSPYRPR